MQTVLLPELNIPDHVTETPLGTVRVPGLYIPERMVVVDPKQMRAVMDAARLATETAYHNVPSAPFAVGAACVMADDGADEGMGEIFSATNCELPVLNSGICAERALLHYVVAKGFRRIKYLAVSTPNRGADDVSLRSPCGLCRQTIIEFCDADSLILIDHQKEGVLCDVLDAARLLPWGYRREE